VDYEADVQAAMANSAQLDILTHRHDQQLGLAWTPVGGALLPIEVMVAKGNGHVNAVGALGGQLQSTAQPAVGYVREHVAEIAPESGIGPDWFARHDFQVGLAWGDVRHGGAPLAGAETAGLAIVAALVSWRLSRGQRRRYITCRPTRPCSGWSKASGAVPITSNPSDFHRRTAGSLTWTTALNWMPR
jgi:ATP-dependent Lon protease